MSLINWTAWFTRLVESDIRSNEFAGAHILILIIDCWLGKMGQMEQSEADYIFDSGVKAKELIITGLGLSVLLFSLVENPTRILYYIGSCIL